MKQKPQTGVIVSQRKPDGSKEEIGNEGEENHGLIACAEDLIRAISQKDPQHIALALRAAFQILESEPHEEGEHTNDYDDQNEKAAQEE